MLTRIAMQKIKGIYKKYTEKWNDDMNDRVFSHNDQNENVI